MQPARDEEGQAQVRLPAAPCHVKRNATLGTR